VSYELVGVAESFAESALSLGGMRSLLSAAYYVFCALALYTIAERRKIKKAWLAWVPVANMWILGSLSDQYRYVAKGEVKNKRKWLLTIGILKMLLSVASVVWVAVTAVLAISGVSQGIGETALVDLLLNGLLKGMVVYVPMLLLGLVGLILELIALYDVYSSCDPANNVLYLILSIIPGISTVARPLFLFLCRDKDAGMPPRRETVVENPAEF
jgi:hypothetical protein